MLLFLDTKGVVDGGGGGGSDVEAQLAEQQEKANALSYAEQQQREREMARQQQIQAVKNRAKTAAKELVKKEAKSLLKTGAKAGARMLWVEIIIPLLPYIGAALAVIAGFIAMIAIVIITIAWQCNATGLQGWLARASSTLAHTLGYTSDFDICAELKIDTSAIAPQTPAPPAQQTGTGLVAIVGVPVNPQTSDPRLTECMLARVQNIYRTAQIYKINFEITSAYRAGATVGSTGQPSAHSRGEAVDIVIIPRSDWRTDQAFAKQIDRLVGIATAEGFVPRAGDTLDEYRKPTEYASGGHIHIEFNIPPGGGSYCNSAL